MRDETVVLCYIDTPFNSKRNYFQIYNNIGKDDAAQTQTFPDMWNELALLTATIPGFRSSRCRI